MNELKKQIMTGIVKFLQENVDLDVASAEGSEKLVEYIEAALIKNAPCPLCFVEREGGIK